MQADSCRFSQGVIGHPVTPFFSFLLHLLVFCCFPTSQCGHLSQGRRIDTLFSFSLRMSCEMVAGRNVDLIVCTIIIYNLYRIICPSDWPHTKTGTPESVVSQNQETKVRKSPHESVLVYSNKWAKTCNSRYILQVFLITDNPKKQTNQFTISTNESGFECVCVWFSKWACRYAWPCMGEGIMSLHIGLVLYGFEGRCTMEKEWGVRNPSREKPHFL